MEEKTMRELSLDKMDQVSGGTGNGTESNGENAGLVGIVTMCMRDNVYSVELTNGHMVTARISAKLRMNSIKLLEGDRVQVEGDWITYIYR